MQPLLAAFSTLADLALVVLGFGLIVFIHELGHFLAARWAGIRVLAFAIGFGPALFSFRQGLGWRRGSSEAEFLRRRATLEAGVPVRAATLSPTEYRINWLPFGGYVKMLGQEDANPGAVSSAPDSFQMCRPWKRLVVISAGVIFNLISAAVLFIIVFMAGLQTEPPRVGDVRPASPAATAVALNAAALRVPTTGLLPGDTILSINGRTPRSFNDLVLATAMAGANESLEVRVQRPGFDTPLEFAILPERSPDTGLLEIGVEPARSNLLPSLDNPADREAFTQALAAAGLAGVRPGMRLIRVTPLPPELAHLPPDGTTLLRALRASQGNPVTADFTLDDSDHVSAAITPRAVLERAFALMPSGAAAPFEHLAGFAPVMTVAAADEQSYAFAQGLRAGDIFARLGAIEFPSLPAGIAEIRGNKNRELDVVVLRASPSSSTSPPSPTANPAAATALERISLRIAIPSSGVIGFSAGTSVEDSTLLGLLPASITAAPPAAGATSAPLTPPAAALRIIPGSRLISVAGTPVANFTQARAALQAYLQSHPPTSTPASTSSSAADATAAPAVEVPIVLEPPALASAPAESLAPISASLSLTPAQRTAITSLGWESPFFASPFELEHITLQAKGPVEAVALGLAETNRVMLTTYITFKRLIWDRTVKIEHLKGPVGIAHLGTLIAERGFIWLLFFLALISVNLAVVNFLPLPIVDGGQFLFILYEQFTGRPVPLGFQNAATLAGLVLIGAMFLIVTYNDVMNLLGV